MTVDITVTVIAIPLSIITSQKNNFSYLCSTLCDMYTGGVNALQIMKK